MESGPRVCLVLSRASKSRTPYNALSELLKVLTDSIDLRILRVESGLVDNNFSAVFILLGNNEQPDKNIASRRE